MSIDLTYSFGEMDNHSPHVLPRELTQVAAAAEAEIRKAIQSGCGVLTDKSGEVDLSFSGKSGI